MKHQKQTGFVLFVVMIFLIVMSLLGITMFGGFIKDQKMSGNLREKQRAIEAAQTVLDNVQNWMALPNNLYVGAWADGVPCSTIGQLGDTPQVCNNALTNPASPSSWTSYQVFQPANNMTVVAAGGGSATTNNYASNVGYYIQYLGDTPKNPPSALYKVTSTAQGGNATAVAVLETVFEVTSLSRDVGN